MNRDKEKMGEQIRRTGRLPERFQLGGDALNWADSVVSDVSDGDALAALEEALGVEAWDSYYFPEPDEVWWINPDGPDGPNLRIALTALEEGFPMLIARCRQALSSEGVRGKVKTVDPERGILVEDEPHWEPTG